MHLEKCNIGIPAGLPKGFYRKVLQVNYGRFCRCYFGASLSPLALPAYGAPELIAGIKEKLGVVLEKYLCARRLEKLGFFRRHYQSKSHEKYTYKAAATNYTVVSSLLCYFFCVSVLVALVTGADSTNISYVLVPSLLSSGVMAVFLRLPNVLVSG